MGEEQPLSLTPLAVTSYIIFRRKHKIYIVNLSKNAAKNILRRDRPFTKAFGEFPRVYRTFGVWMKVVSFVYYIAGVHLRSVTIHIFVGIHISWKGDSSPAV